MIFEVVAEFLMGILSGVLGLLPDFNPDFQTFGSALGGALAGANSVFPATVLGACIASLVALEGFLLLFNFITWVYAKVPFLFR